MGHLGDGQRHPCRSAAVRPSSGEAEERSPGCSTAASLLLRLSRAPAQEQARSGCHPCSPHPALNYDFKCWLIKTIQGK